MAEITIRLRRDPETGKNDIIIEMESDMDALPHEHEQMHREAVEKIIGKNNIGKVVIVRDDEKSPSAPVAAPPQEEKQAAKQGGT